jgi:hypothetical protein
VEVIMGYRNIQENDVKLTVRSFSAHTLVVVNAKLAPGQIKTIPLRYVVENYQRALELSDLVNRGKIQLTFNNTTYDYVTVGPLTPAYLAGLASPSAMPYGGNVSGLVGDRPGFADVPVGFCYYNTTTNAPNYSTGAGWVNGAGVAA